MSADIVPFAFEGVEVRTLTINGETWFVLADLCNYLGISNPSNVAARLDPTTTDTLRLTEGNRGNPNVTIVNESGMYEAVIRSDKPEAVRFRHWLTGTVLPEIRRTGSYGHPADDLALPTDYLSALKALVQREEQNVELAQQNAELTPRAIAWDAIASAEGDYSVGEAAKMLAHAGISNMGPQRLFSRLADIGWTFRAGAAWQAKADRVEKGFLSIKPQFHYHRAPERA
ncbi:phage antirepressor KilAC domain-containing protein [Leifsonia poae]|uniref:phage antirepressor KilAC domain-containing protein n=1 Tax=Leifsonia poae TaxID=110933 RepID=UPI001CBD3BE7|nr:phage antirepressor KilAC domain-containing protein [Leifsonia poae]